MYACLFFPTGALMSAPVHHTGTLQGAPVFPRRRALMRACLPYRCTSKAHLNFFLTRTHAHVFSVQACTHAPLPLSRPCMRAHPLPKTPLNLPYDPPYLPHPKIGNLQLCRMFRPLTYNSHAVDRVPRAPGITQSPLNLLENSL
jgi:hypothetical protein